MRSKYLKLSVLAVLMLSFVAVGCSEETCKGLLAQLQSLQNQIISIANERMKVDAKGDDMGRAVELYQQEMNARRNFSETAERYIARGCQEKTGDVPSIPPMNPATEIELP
ncbi:MAG: hypothetical protein AAF462_08905 [Thermodesulfobacteriota bacterium]